MTRNFVPNNDGEGSLGTTLKNWLSGFFKWLNISQYIDFKTTVNPTHSEGRVFYDSVEKSLSQYLDNSEITQQLGQEVLLRVKNETGTSIADGKVVRIIGSNGVGCPTIMLAQADVEVNARAIGLTICTINDSDYGYVTLCGKVHNQNTIAWLESTTLYLSATTPGDLTNVKPSIAVIIAFVIKSHATDGILHVNVNELGVVGADMLKSIYDTNDNGLVNGAETVDDGINQSSAVDVKDAVDKKHNHSNQSELDLITDGDHDVRTDNPHSVTKTQVGLGNVTNDAQLKRADGDINSFSEQATPVANDIVIIEDSTALFAKKKVKLSNLNLHTKEQFCIATDFASNLGNYRTRSIAGSGSYRFTFKLPDNYTSLLSVDLIGIVSAAAAQTARNIDLASEYAAIGEIYNTNTESDTTTTYNLSGYSSEIYALNLLTVLTGVAPRDLVGVLVTHVAIGGSIDYLGIRIKYI
jgi:hypothetical protein